MQNILAFEAADFRLTVALMKDGQVVGEYCSESPYGHDSELLPAIEKILQQHHLCYSQLDLIATTSGPGSFTGIRVALATAEGLSLASGVPAVAFNSFEWVHSYVSSSMGAQATEKMNVLVTLESKRQDVYAQLFDIKGQALKEPTALMPGELASYLENKEGVCIGSGCYKLKTDKYGLLRHLAEYDLPTASSLCSYARQKVLTEGIEAFSCAPFYLRLPDVTFPKT